MAEVRDAGSAEIVKTEEKRMRPMVGADGFGACDVDNVERSLAKFAEVAASSPNVRQLRESGGGGRGRWVGGIERRGRLILKAGGSACLCLRF